MKSKTISAMLELRNLSFSYSKNDELLKNISFSLYPGDILTILGQNGSGKSTLVNCILGHINNFSGNIFLKGRENSLYTIKELSQIIAYVPQLTDISFDYTVEEFVLMGRNPHLGYLSLPTKNDYDIVDKILSELNIKKLAYRCINNLSGGERQLVYIAKALVQQPEIIILDEPTSALDYANSIKIINLLNKLSKEFNYTIIMSCHNPEYPFVFKSKTIAIYKNEGFIFGDTLEILNKDSLTRIYGVDVQPLFLEKYNQYVCVSEKFSN